MGHMDAISLIDAARASVPLPVSRKPQINVAGPPAYRPVPTELSPFLQLRGL